MNKTKHAFTFVELLVVVSLFSILSLTVYATFASGMRMWSRIQDTSLIQRKVSLGLEKFSLELRQALDFSKIGFTGKSNEISFPFLADSVIQDGPSNGVVTVKEILRITYFLEQKTLFRKLDTFKDILEEKEQAKIKTLLSDIEDLKFSFAYREEGKDQYSWKDTWDKEEGIPVIVKMELKIKDAQITEAITIPAS